MTINTMIQIEEREPSFTFSFVMNELEHWDLPKVSTPGLLSRECSLFGMLSREHSLAGLGSADVAGPATNDSSASEAMEEEEGQGWTGEQGACFSGYPTQPYYEFYTEAAQPVYTAAEQGFSSHCEEAAEAEACLKRKCSEPAQEFAFTCEQEAKKRRVVSARRPAGKRGSYVKERPQMQQSARDGQKHWGNMVVELRKEWNAKKMWEQNEHFHGQIQLCSRLHIKSQHECLLRQLQMAAVEGLIEPKAFSSDESQSFLGWTGFEVVRGRGAEFRRTIEELFAHRPNDKTLNNALRRAGLVPQRGWAEAWSGLGAFVFDAQKRAQYGARE